jgi:hypothetical protein
MIFKREPQRLGDRRSPLFHRRVGERRHDLVRSRIFPKQVRHEAIKKISKATPRFVTSLHARRT